MWYCNCGHSNSDDGNFCTACGVAKSNVYSDQISCDYVWHYYKGQQRFGPSSSKDIARLLYSGELNRNTLVWKSGMTNWVPLHQTALSTLAPDLMPPMPLQAASDGYAWALAIMPISTNIILKLTRVNVVVSLIVGGFLTLFFWGLDVFELKKTNNAVWSWAWSGLVATPAYLFIRANKAGQRYGYAITWCFLYVFYFIIIVIMNTIRAV